MVKKFRRYLYYSFWRNSRTWQTDGQTDRRTPHAGNSRAMHSITRQKRKVADNDIYSTTVCCQSGNNNTWQSMARPYSPSLAEGTTSDQCKETDHSEGERRTTNWDLSSWIAQVFLARARTAGYMCIGKAWDCFVVVIFALVLVMTGTTAYRSFERNATRYSK